MKVGDLHGKVTLYIGIGYDSIMDALPRVLNHHRTESSTFN